jgi:uncharacterized protein
MAESRSNSFLRNRRSRGRSASDAVVVAGVEFIAENGEGSVHWTMLFEWDEGKSRRTLEERGFGFEYAARIFLGPTLERQDDRREYGEIRVQAIGQVSDDILFVVYTDRDDIRHIISARLASRKERKLWQSFAEQWKTSAE